MDDIGMGGSLTGPVLLMKSSSPIRSSFTRTAETP